ncbi:hypothetical protein [Acetobacter fallax]|uniref:Uncharacterized protein n=1 Tax=Acetobacter fallax TaxID=1737473 RepID=A0ABX0KBL4_9PROT|nr:hypothetical protein [Acetobacter fallax]NHO33832.1 hypothetical protein [Acetobacter fallax]
MTSADPAIADKSDTEPLTPWLVLAGGSVDEVPLTVPVEDCTTEELTGRISPVLLTELLFRRETTVSENADEVVVAAFEAVTPRDRFPAEAAAPFPLGLFPEDIDVSTLAITTPDRLVPISYDASFGPQHCPAYFSHSRAAIPSFEV